MRARTKRLTKVAVTDKRVEQGGARMSRRAWLGMALGGAVIGLGMERWWRRANPGTVDVGATPILVFASPTCSCCHAWMNHLDVSGFRVSRELVVDVTPVKRKYNVPDRLWSCHTALVDGYVIEGHVPADVLRKLIAERPAVAGIAVAGMPPGSPGMEGTQKERYDVIAFTREGEASVYASR